MRHRAVKALSRIHAERGDQASRKQESVAMLTELVARMQRYERALRRIAETDEAGCPHVKVALEALNP
jgi:hypothetical protein